MRFHRSEIDNVAFAAALSERARRRVEEFGRVQLSDSEAAALSLSKLVHMCLVVLIVLVVVATEEFFAAFLAFPVLFLGAVAEALVAGGGAVKVCAGIVKSFVAMFGGLVCYFMLVSLAHSGFI